MIDQSHSAFGGGNMTGGIAAALAQLFGKALGLKKGDSGGEESAQIGSEEVNEKYNDLLLA